MWSQYQLFHHHSSTIFAGLDRSETDHKELIESHTDCHKTVETSTDGSVCDGEGTYSYLLFAMPPNSSTALAYGEGKESCPSLIEECATKVQSYCISSARMEEHTILGLQVACKYLDPNHLLEFHNVSDSTAAIKMYEKLMSLNRMELPNIPDSDV